MEQVLKDVGMSDKEARIYLVLLDNQWLSAAEIAKETNESRTNTYMLLDSLLSLGLVEEEGSRPIKRFVAAPPKVLRDILAAKQEEIKKASTTLNGYLPELTSKYRLSQHKPGVIYREGLDGLRDALEDQIRSADKEILLIPSSNADEHAEAFEMLKKATIKRKAHGIKTRALIHEGARDWEIIKFWPKHDVEVRYIGKSPYTGEVIIYGDTSLFLEYTTETVITTALTNKNITATMKQLFEELWQKAKK